MEKKKRERNKKWLGKCRNNGEKLGGEQFMEMQLREQEPVHIRNLREGTKDIGDKSLKDADIVIGSSAEKGKEGVSEGKQMVSIFVRK